MLLALPVSSEVTTWEPAQPNRTRLTLSRPGRVLGFFPVPLTTRRLHPNAQVGTATVSTSKYATDAVRVAHDAAESASQADSAAEHLK